MVSPYHSDWHQWVAFFVGSHLTIPIDDEITNREMDALSIQQDSVVLGGQSHSLCREQKVYQAVQLQPFMQRTNCVSHY